MDLWIAFTLGVVGSLHCAGMCGPLALALPRGGRDFPRLLAGRSAYNLGRTITYGAIGAIFGLFGKTLALAGVQRWISIGLGILLLAGWFVVSQNKLSGPVSRIAFLLTSRMRPFLASPSITGMAGMGLLNGLLPCGLVYVAAAGAAATGSVTSGAAYMVVFGLGTIPMLLAISLSGNLVPFALRIKLARAVPVAVIALATLLILRGMSLGIPYISPVLGATEAACCHPATP